MIFSSVAVLLFEIPFKERDAFQFDLCNTLRETTVLSVRLNPNNFNMLKIKLFLMLEMVYKSKISIFYLQGLQVQIFKN